MPYSQYAKALTEIARKAGQEIMTYYNTDIEVQIKADDSPLTKADLASNKIIIEALQTLAPDIPAVTEEASKESNEKAAQSEMHWLIDPLDGTKSFIKKSGQFTVNIGLVKDNHPIGGVIYVPVTKDLYFVGEDGSAYKQEEGKEPVKITVKAPSEEGLLVVASKSHSTPQTDEYINSLGKVKERVSASSSLKFCLIAEGAADIYPRFGTTMEWDTAAGHAIVEAAGGRVDNPDGTPFAYGKPDFVNGYFIVYGK